MEAAISVGPTISKEMKWQMPILLLSWNGANRLMIEKSKLCGGFFSVTTHHAMVFCLFKYFRNHNSLIIIDRSRKWCHIWVEFQGLRPLQPHLFDGAAGRTLPLGWVPQHESQNWDSGTIGGSQFLCQRDWWLIGSVSRLFYHWLPLLHVQFCFQVPLKNRTRNRNLVLL